MQIVDLVEHFVSRGSYRHDYPSYEQLYPALFEHYFRYWSTRAALPPKSENADLVSRRDRVISMLPETEDVFSSAGLPLDDMKVVLFVGVGTSNGHAMNDGDEFIVWLPVETFQSSRQIQVFVAHELAHALQYTRSPGCYFETVSEMQHFARLLITEGMATYVSRIVLDCEDSDALWADYLSPDRLRSWMTECRADEADLASFALKHFDSNAHREFFQANNADDIYSYRAGYYLGLRAIELIAQQRCCGPSDLLAAQRPELEVLTREVLSQMSLSS